MEELYSEAELKQAFRIVFDYMNRHRAVPKTLDEYKDIMDDMWTTYVNTGKLPIVRTMISAAHTYIYDEAQRRKEGRS